MLAAFYGRQYPAPSSWTVHKKHLSIDTAVGSFLDLFKSLNSYEIICPPLKLEFIFERQLSIGVVTGPLIGSQKGPLPLVASGQRA